MIFRQFCAPDTQLSYLLADPVSRYAAVIDPHIGAERNYLEAIQELDLHLVYAVETHAHESHASASPLLREHTGARLVTHSSVGIDCVDMQVDDGDALFIGEESVTVLSTPGHSPCSICLFWRDRLFTGHTLLSGASGDCRRSDASAGALFDSLRSRVLVHADETLVFPGRLFMQRRVSSIGQERAINDDLRFGSTRDEFVRRKRLEALHGEKWRPAILRANKRCEFN